MVSYVNLMAYIFSVLLILAVGIVLIYFLHKNSKSIESGLFGSVGYGVTGFLWGGLLFPMFFAGVFGKAVFSVLEQNFFLGYLLISSVFNAFFTLLANVWGIFLTNQKKQSLYRSSAVGLGFGFTNAVIMTALPLRIAIAINWGTVGNTIDITKFTSTLPITVLSVGIKMVVVIIFYTYVAMLLGKLINEKEWKKAIAVGLLYYGGFYLITTLLEQIPPVISECMSMVVMITIGSLCIRMICIKLFKAQKRFPDEL